MAMLCFDPRFEDMLEMERKTQTIRFNAEYWYKRAGWSKDAFLSDSFNPFLCDCREGLEPLHIWIGNPRRDSNARKFKMVYPTGWYVRLLPGRIIPTAKTIAFRDGFSSPEELINTLLEFHPQLKNVQDIINHQWILIRWIE